MGDQAHDFAEQKIAEFQAEVWETYQQAQADAQEALSRFLKRFEKEDERQREKVKAGELSEADYKAWRKGKILRSRQLSSTLGQVSQAMTEANRVAMAALNGKLPEVYAENANYAAFSICKETGAAVAFDLVDPDTVGHMLTAGAALLPAVDVAKDVAWNRKLVSSQLTQGVLLGESIPKIARRVQNVTGSNIATAMRTARTAVTGAECAGRMNSYERAKGMGIKLKKEWVSTLDNRTRHSHRQLDGERIDNDEKAKFSNGCRYPGDPTARYAEICNCRCTVIAAVEGFETDDAERWSKLPKGMTYEEWKNELAPRPQARAKAGAVHAPAHDSGAAVYQGLDKSQKQAIEAILNRSDEKVRQVYLGYESMFKLLDGNWQKTAQYDPAANGVRLNLAKVFATNGDRPQGTTWFHEFGHMVDSLSGDVSETYKDGVFAKTIQSEANAYIDARNKQLRAGFKRAVAEKDTDWLVANGYMSSWKAEYIRENPDMEKTALAALKHTKTYAYRAVADEIRSMNDAQKADLSDLFGGATVCKCEDGWGHEKTYWRPKLSQKGYELKPLAHEGFAEFFSAYTANPESLEMLRKYLPESTKIFEEMIEEVLR
ncbi:MAG: phage minor head protein [Slackia isoflavoniconvertens]|nr:phage minor head protein [Slackia isoflavoniconvertens]